MRIKKLDLYGFKSFPDRTTFHFGAGISCVVGPNGSGKSNVVDALRWCIGEQSARSLRGGDMLDVIFAGSTDRPPVGFAEVALTLSADDGEPFPGEYAQHAELQIGRRLHRTGVSEYLVNQVKVRRRDVVELLLDTGIGNNLYSFIAQGQVDRMVHATPLERRGIIDEAAGITRYAARREESRQRLEATATQLDRAADVADEMAKRLKDLERQAIRAANFRRVRARIRQAEILLSLVKYHELAGDRRALRTSLRETEGDVAATRRELARRETDLASRREEVDLAETTANLRRDEVAELDARHRELESTRQLQERRRDESIAQLNRARQDVDAAEGDASLASERERRATQERAEAMDTLEALARAREERQRAAEVAQGRVERARTLVTEGLAAVEAAKGSLAGLVASATALQRQLDALPERRQRIDLAGANATGRRGEADAKRDSLASSRVQLEVRLDQARARADALAATQSAATAAESSAEATWATADRAAQDARARWEGERRRLDRERESRRQQDERVLATRRSETSAATKALRAKLESQRQARWGAVRESGTAAERRGATWTSAAEAWANRLDAAWEAEERRQVSEADVEARDALERVEREGVAALTATLAAAERSRAEAVAAADAARGRAEEGWTSAVQRTRELEGRAAKLDREIEGALDRRRGLREQMLGEQADQDARAALGRWVADPRPLLDRLSLTPEEAAAVAPLLGDRLLLPLVDGSELVRLARGLPAGGRVRVLLAGADDPLGALRSHVAEVADVEAMVARRPDGRAVVASEGSIRLEPDGLVRIGAEGDQVARAVSLRVALAEVEASLERLEAEAVQTHAELETSRAEVVGAEEQARRARAEAERVDRESRRSVESVRAEGRADLDRRLTELRDDHRIRRDLTTKAFDAQVAVRRRERGERAAALREELAAVLDTLRAELDAGARADLEREVALAESAERELEAALEAEVTALRSVAAARAAADEQALASLEGEANAAASTSAAQRATLETARAARRAADDDANLARDDLARLAREVDRVDAEIAVSAQGSSDAVARLGELARELADLEAAERDLRSERDVVEASVGEARREVASAEAGLVEAQALATSCEDAARVLQDGIREDDLRAATLTERSAALSSAAEGARVQGDQATERASRARELVVELEGTAADAEQSRAAAESEAESVATARAQRWDQLQIERERLRTVRDGLRKAEEQLEGLRTRKDALERKQAELEQRNQDAKLEIEVLRRRVDERYQVSLPGLLDRLAATRQIVLEVDDEVRAGFVIAGRTLPGVDDVTLTPDVLQDGDRVTEEVAALEAARAELQALGEVNLSAIEEHRDMATRYADLEAQRADLEASIATIRAAIAKMNRTCRERFRDAFDRVNEHFQALYPRLVGGGNARLALTDEEDLLETGVDIFVQPPGKRLQNLTLLSGGEKAMTAIALMISLFRVKPSPFCVLDEVDAPLDEANGTRFNEILREMASIAQFLVITHNRKTMECADTLYGITMARPGVSRLVSVEL